ncbi:MAG: hypothetical protein LC107_02215 [Chitinophagales bacterium]|nr:hypothetical protein [Chitinophagales bacterium]
MNMYLKGLAITLLILGPLLVCIHIILAPYADVAVTAVVMFILLSLALYLVLKRLAIHPNRQLFLSVTMLNVLVKIIFTGILIFGYIQETSPPNNNFVLSVLAVYVAFTIFESWFMTRIAQSDATNKIP